MTSVPGANNQLVCAPAVFVGCVPFAGTIGKYGMQVGGMDHHRRCVMNLHSSDGKYYN